MKLSEGGRSILFLLVMSLVVGNGLAAISLGLKERVDRNREMLRVRSLLAVLAVPGREGRTDEELGALYREKVSAAEGEGGVYVYREGGTVVAYAFDASGRGLWDRIKGFLAVEADGVTIREVQFYEQNETPGLGGEIGTGEFARRFRGKKLREGGQLVHIVKAGRAAELGSTEVDGITGATLTCEAVNRILSDAVGAFLERGEGQEAME